MQAQIIIPTISPARTRSYRHLLMRGEVGRSHCKYPFNLPNIIDEFVALMVSVTESEGEKEKEIEEQATEGDGRHAIPITSSQFKGLQGNHAFGASIHTITFR